MHHNGSCTLACAAAHEKVRPKGNLSNDYSRISMVHTKVCIKTGLSSTLPGGKAIGRHFLDEGVSVDTEHPGSF